VALKAAYTYAIITAAVPSINAVNGQPLPYSPRWSGAATIGYRGPTIAQVTPTYGATYAYHGPVNTGFTGATGAFGANSGVFALHSYATLDLRVGVDWSHYSLSARIKNATNKYGVTFAGFNYSVPGNLAGSVIQPRTLDISLSSFF